MALDAVHVINHAMTIAFACESRAQESLHSFHSLSILRSPNRLSIYTINHVDKGSHKENRCCWRQWLPRYTLYNPTRPLLKLTHPS